MIQLALPVIATYLGFMLMGIVDLICVGRLNAQSIGAVGVGTSIFTWVMIFGFGLLAGIDYLVSFAQGAGKPEDGYRALVQGLIATSVLSLPLTALLWVIAAHLDWIGVNPEVLPLARSYMMVLAPSLWPLLVFSAFRQYLTALEVARPGMYLLLVGNILNAAVNWVLDFGHLGAPALGVAGAAWATLISRTVMMIVMGWYLWRWDARKDRLRARLGFRYERETMARFLKLGLPSAFQMLFEVGVFALSTTLASRLAPQSLAAHQIVLNIASLTFMVPMGLSSATAVLVANALGRGDRVEARRTGWRGLGYGASFMACSGVMLFFFHVPIISVFTKDALVQRVAAHIILIAALFQLSDGTQVVATGALRGWGDTRSPMFGHLLGHWGVGLPIGLWLCFGAGWGLVGLWTGLSAGLTAVALGLLWVWQVRSRGA